MTLAQPTIGHGGGYSSGVALRDPVLVTGSAGPLASGMPARWIVSRRFDLGWFFGGAVVSLAVIGLYFGAGLPILVLWWTWLLAFDGPHIAAAFTRTYLDREEWRARRGVLVRGLLIFGVGPLLLLLGLVTDSAGPFQLFLAAAVLYAYYHIVRQHYGFMALYRAVNGERDRLDRIVDTWTLYVGLWAPYVYFGLTHPRARRVMSLPSTGPAAVAIDAIVIAAVVIWVLTLAAFVARGVVTRSRLNRPKVAYLLTTILLYGLIYFLIARFEPAYAQSNGPDQDFLLLSVLITVFHNIQYLGLVWFYNHNRYGQASPSVGPAFWINRSLVRFLAACGVFSIVYLLFACWTDVFPGCGVFAGVTLGAITASQIGLCLWWGLALQHYYLDQRIWRLSADASLKRYLKLV
jgi:hypothetical protein